MLSHTVTAETEQEMIGNLMSLLVKRIRFASGRKPRTVTLTIKLEMEDRRCLFIDRSITESGLDRAEVANFDIIGDTTQVALDALWTELRRM